MTFADFVDRFNHVFQLYLSSASGRGQFQWMFGYELPHPALAPSLIVSSMTFGFIVAAGMATGFLRNSGPHRWLGFVSIIILVVFVQAVLTRQTGGAHHMMVFWPLTQIQLVLCGLVLAAPLRMSLAVIMPSSFARRIPPILGAVLSLALGASALLADRDFDAAMAGTRTVALFSPEIAILNDKLRDLRVERVYSVDWGLNHQLVALAEPSRRAQHIDTWPLFSESPGAESRVEWLFRNFVADRRVAFISYADPLPNLPQNHLSKSYLLAHWPKCPTSEFIIAGWNHQPLYKIELLDCSAPHA